MATTTQARGGIAAWLIGAGLILGGCAASPDPDSLDWDPYEDKNRPVHESNRDLDRTVYGPMARAYGDGMPQPWHQGVRNLRNHWRLPAHTIQYGLQGRPMRVAESSMRFMINSIFGFAGLLDPAVEMGLPYRETNFDETFYVWGLPEGGYMEVPLVGPGTQRDYVGWVLDIATDPMAYVLPVPAVWSLTAAAELDILYERYELDTALQAILHESTDSYEALRLSYLQNMRARLQGGTSVEQLEDVYADF